MEGKLFLIYLTISLILANFHAQDQELTPGQGRTGVKENKILIHHLKIIFYFITIIRGYLQDYFFCHFV